MTEENEHQLTAIMVGVLLALLLWVLSIIASDPAAFTQALMTPCNVSDCC